MNTKYILKANGEREIFEPQKLIDSLLRARARKEIANTAKQICDVSNVAIYKFVILNEDQAREKIHYMLGKKKVKKLHNVKITEEWRKKENLKQIYSSEVPLSCWDLGTGTDENLETEWVEPDL